MPDLSRTSAIAFADQLRSARHSALGDAEGYGEIVHAIERLGAYLAKESVGDKGLPGGLTAYKAGLWTLAERSALAASVPAQHRGLHTPFDWLYTLVRTGRNDAMHQGAFARHLTVHAIELAIMLEDALTQYKEPVIGDFMVRNPVCAELWQPISYIRQQMLANSYSCLPVLNCGLWYLVPDTALAVYLGAEREGSTRRQRLAATLGDVFSYLNLKVTEPKPESASLAEGLDALAREPVLLIHRSEDEKTLAGLLTAYDLL